MGESNSSGSLRIVVLGAGAGGGVPQWNCNCDVCLRARSGDGSVIPRTQSSIAVSPDGIDWCIFNCSPDIRQQLLASEYLHPRTGYSRRDSPVRSVVLTNGDVDHIAGLLVLREKQAFRLFATPAILSILEANPVFKVLDPAFVTRHPLPLEKPVEAMPGLVVEAFSVPGKVALYREEEARDAEGQVALGSETEDTVGLRIGSAAAGGSFFYIPGCAAMTDALKARLDGAGVVLFDGTVWENAEMLSHGVGEKTGERMGHMSISGPSGSLAAFEGVKAGRKVYVHLNNTNPVLIEDSPERAAVEAAGWEVAWDGMEITVP